MDGASAKRTFRIRHRPKARPAANVLTAIVLGLVLGAGHAWAQDAAAQAREALRQAPLIDGHNDVAIRLRERLDGDLSGFQFGRLTEEQRRLWHTDVDWLRRGGVGGEFWSVYVPANLAPDEAVRMTIEQIDLVKRLVAQNPQDLALATSVAEVEEARKAHKIACLIGAEGGHSIGGSLAVLRQFYALGVRYMTLTHGRTTSWADSATDAPQHDGLTPFGVEVVREMNRLGMLVDLSHVSAATMNDVLDVAEAPVIFSHSSAYALVPHPRNVPDAVMARLRRNDGVIMVSLVPRATNPAINAWAAAQEGEQARLASLHPDDPAVRETAMGAWLDAHPRPVATFAQVADHIDHVRKVAGIEHIGIGSDLEGDRFEIEGMENASGFEGLFTELARRGYSQNDLMLISRGNILRVMREAEAAAARLQRQRGAGMAASAQNSRFRLWSTVK